MDIPTFSAQTVLRATKDAGRATRCVEDGVSDCTAPTCCDWWAIRPFGPTCGVERPPARSICLLGLRSVEVLVGPLYLPCDEGFEWLLPWPALSGTPVAYPFGAKGVQP